MSNIYVVEADEERLHVVIVPLDAVRCGILPDGDLYYAGQYKGDPVAIIKAGLWFRTFEEARHAALDWATELEEDFRKGLKRLGRYTSGDKAIPLVDIADVPLRHSLIEK